MTTPIASEEPQNDMFATARSAEDLISYGIFSLGFWPQESVVVVSADGDRLGPCARMDLPGPKDSLAEWGTCLEPMFETLASHGRWERTFLMAFTGKTETLRLEGTEGFLLEEQSGAALLMLAAVAHCHDLPPEQLWVIDDDDARWGELRLDAGEPDSEEEPGGLSMTIVPPGSDGAVDGYPWLIDHRGSADQIRTSTVGTALVAEGYVMDRTGRQAEAEHGGEVDLIRVCGSESAAEISETFQELVDRRRKLYPGDSGFREMIDALEDSLSALMARKDWADSRSSLTAEDVRVLDLKLMAAWSAKVTGTLGVTLLMAAAGRGPEAAKTFLQNLFSKGLPRNNADTSAVANLLGDLPTWPDRKRLSVLRVLLGIVEQLGDMTSAAQAAAALGFVNWHLGNSSQAARCAQRASGLGADLSLRTLYGAQARRPMPAWFSNGWADSVEPS